MIPSLNVQYARAHRYLVKTVLSTFTNGITVLDVGCGGGTILLHLAHSLKTLNSKSMLIGLDIDVKDLHELKKDSEKIGFGKDIALIQASAERLPIRDRSVNLLVCTHVLEHVKDDKAAFKEINRALTRKGILWFAAPRPLLRVSPIHMPLMWFMGRGVGHVRSGYIASDINFYSRKSGFKILAIFDNPDLLYFLLYQYPLALMTLINRMLGKHNYEGEGLSQIKRVALKLDDCLPSLPQFGSGYTIVATKLS